MDDRMYKGDDGTALRFHTKAVRNNFQSEKHGRAIHDSVLYVDVMVPGNSAEAPTFEVVRTYCEEAGLDKDGNRIKEYGAKYEQYRRQVDAYLSQSGEGAVDGTPLEQWPVVDTALVANLKAVGVNTVEQLSQVHDGNLANLGLGGRQLREQARTWLASREFSVPSAQIGAENASLKDRVAELERLCGEKDALIAGLTSELNTVRAGAAGTPPPALPVVNLGASPVSTPAAPLI